MSRVFITGSADGLGRMAGAMLARQGHAVTLHARNDRRADDARRAVPKAEAVITGDLATITGMRQVAKAAHARATRRNPTTWFGRIALLVLAILLAALPFCAFLVAADLTATYLQPRESTKRVVIVLIH